MTAPQLNLTTADVIRQREANDGAREWRWMQITGVSTAVVRLDASLILFADQPPMYLDSNLVRDARWSSPLPEPEPK